jgi:hypothetical protein
MINVTLSQNLNWVPQRFYHPGGYQFLWCYLATRRKDIKSIYINYAVLRSKNIDKATLLRQALD